MKHDLNGLSNPAEFQGSISINNIDPNLLKDMLMSMILIRKTEQKLSL